MNSSICVQRFIFSHSEPAIKQPLWQRAIKASFITVLTRDAISDKHFPPKNRLPDKTAPGRECSEQAGAQPSPQTLSGCTSSHNHSLCWTGSTGRISRLLSAGQSYLKAPLKKKKRKKVKKKKKEKF